ncbi:hypothetical protein RRG08_005611 [Elysia crispata]|uniref:Uncharacterized protein n=1 Tax=Elysia crispata TaxID=231223 RepID=A0AAE1D6X2_9GAST|nr:hypothetical protein RRG08_005611 [Elysia crispata]
MRDYGRIKRLVTCSKELVDKTMIQLFVVNRHTLIQWYNKKVRRMEVDTLRPNLPCFSDPEGPSAPSRSYRAAPVRGGTGTPTCRRAEGHCKAEATDADRSGRGDVSADSTVRRPNWQGIFPKPIGVSDAGVYTRCYS